MKKAQGAEKTGPKKRRGFDFGSSYRTMLFIDHEYLKHLYAADIVGCSYGMTSWPDVPGMIPIIAFVCNAPDHLKSAFQHFERWGSAGDGDVVSIDIMFRADGTYALGIGPEINRAIFRIMPAALHPPIALGATFIKIMDTTNPVLKSLEKYAKRTISPIAIGGVGFPSEAPLLPENVKPVGGLSPILKFETRIFSSDAVPHDSALMAYRNRNPGDGDPPNVDPSSPAHLPKDVVKARRKIIEAAFPVTKLRVLRGVLCDAVPSTAGYEQVTDDQVCQACANLLVSAELCDGHEHYPAINGEDLADKIWAHVRNRFEYVDGADPISGMPTPTVRAQINLDARAILNSFNIATANLPFPKVQKLMIKKGFLGD